MILKKMQIQTNTQLKTALSSKVANILRQEIYENKIEVGEHLNEVAIAARFGISRGPLREAIRILESEGLVKTPPNGRTIVIGFSENEIIEYYKLRYFIESEAIKKILLEPEDASHYDWLISLEELIRENKQYLKNNYKNTFAEVDYQFHLSINTRANNKISLQLWKLLANMSMTIIEMNKQYMAENYADGLVDALKYHEKILMNLKKRDLDKVLDSLKSHMQKGEDTFCSIIKNIPHLLAKEVIKE
jgi:DNA-binding GntR family transcriptional regulator